MSAVHRTKTHLKRWITGLSALPLLVYLVYRGGAAFTGLVVVAAVLALWEYYRIVFEDAGRFAAEPICVCGYLAAAAMIGFGAGFEPALIVLLIALDLVLVAVYSVFRFSSDPAVVLRVARQLQGLRVFSCLKKLTCYVVNQSRRGIAGSF